MTIWHVDETGSATAPYDTWVKALDIAAFETHLEAGSWAAGDIYFIRGNLALTQDILSYSNDGTPALPLHIVGLKAATSNEGTDIVYSDWGTVSNRPLWTTDQWYFYPGDYTFLYNIDFAGTDTYCVFSPAGGTVVNCKFTNTSGTSNRYGYYRSGVGGRTIGCDLSSTNGIAFRHGSSPSFVMNCYIHDCTGGDGTGILCGAGGLTIVNTIFDNLLWAVNHASHDSVSAINCTFQECDIGMGATDAIHTNIINSIFDNCDTTSVQMTSKMNCNFFWNNNFHSNTEDYDATYVETAAYHPAADQKKTIEDPLFTLDGEDFSLQSDSGCRQAGMPLLYGVG